MLDEKDISLKKLPWDVIAGFLVFLFCYRLVRRFGSLDFVSPRWRMFWLFVSFLLPALGAYLLWRAPTLIWARRSIFAAGPSLMLGLAYGPWLAVCFGTFTKWTRKLAFVLLGWMFLSTSLAVFLDWNAISYRIVRDQEYERTLVATLNLQNSKMLPILAYRELLPSTQEPYVEVVQERPIFDSLRLRRLLTSDSEADDVQMKEIDDEENEVECTFLLNGTGTGSTESFRVR